MHYVRRLGLTLVCDFRQLVEQELDPTPLEARIDLFPAKPPVFPGAESFQGDAQ